MFKRILSIVFMISCVVGGAVGADFIKSQGASTSKDGHATSPAKHDKAKDDHGKSSDHGKADKKSKGHDKAKDKGHDKKSGGHDKKADKGGGGHGDSDDGGSAQEYMKFKRQFVVPVMQGGNIDALVIMNLSVALNGDAPSDSYNYLPRMRDAFTRELLSLSDEDVFGANLTSVESYQRIHEKLLTAAQQVMPEGVEDVLILDLARQEQ